MKVGKELRTKARTWAAVGCVLGVVAVCGTPRAAQGTGYDQVAGKNSST